MFLPPKCYYDCLIVCGDSNCYCLPPWTIILLWLKELTLLMLVFGWPARVLFERDERTMAALPLPACIVYSN